MENNQDIKLCYFGGSGGFIILHLLLLSDQFFCKFPGDLTLEEIIDHQWDIDDPLRWKSKEIWPINEITKTCINDKRKIYFFCNPTIEDISGYDGKIVFLYTDIVSQIELCRFKQANIFFNESTSLYKNYVAYYREKLKPWQEFYSNVKDPTWPRCTGPSGFRNLPDHIKSELLEKEKKWVLQWLDIKKFTLPDTSKIQKKVTHKLSKRFTLPDGTDVDEDVFNFYKFADIPVKLNDVINDLDKLSSITGCTPNQYQKDLKIKWISLHPQSLLTTLKIKN